MTYKRYRLKNSLWIYLFVVWTLLFGLSLWQQIHISKTGVMALAEREAVTSYNRDLVYRRWAATHGGVYVTETVNTPANPYLEHVFERDITTPSGRRLTLVNPAYMTRQVYALSRDQNGVKGHITSLNPLRPENAAVHWEREQLLAIERGHENNASIDLLDGEQHLRMMFPMVTEERCLKCHAMQGYQTGDIRGGISVSVPLAGYLSIHAQNVQSLVRSDAVLWLLGIAGIFGMRRYVNRQFAFQSRMRQSAEESQQKYQVLFDNSPYGAVVADYDTGKILTCNHELLAMTGYSEDELVGQPQTILHPVPETPEPYSERFSRHRKAPDRTNLETQIQTKQGELRDVEIKVNRLEVDGRQVLHGYFNDITEKKLATEALRQSDEKFMLAFKHAPIAIAITRTNDGTYLEVNKKFCEYSGCSYDEVIGKTSLEIGIFTTEIREKVLTAMRQDGHIAGMELQYGGKDGTLREATYFGEFIEFDGEQRLLSLVLDITERRELEGRLRHTDKLQVIGQLAGGIAHDFNNQLSGIMGYAEVLRLHLKGSKLETIVDKILICARNSADSTSKLLAFSRKGQYSNEAIDIHNVLHDVDGILEHSIDKRIVIRKNLAAVKSFIWGDVSQIQNAFLNLAINARDAIAEAGEIAIETSNVTLNREDCLDISAELTPGEYLRVQICDNGCGMSAEVRRKIFEPFFTTKGIGKGTGMGLAAVYGTIKSHHGGIVVCSESGVGTTFTNYLPLWNEKKEQIVNSELDGSELHGLKILTIDDEENVRIMSSQLLELYGCDVHSEADGDKGVAYFQQHWQELDLVILDLIMPQMAGEETYRALRAINPEARVLIASGFSNAGVVDNLLSDGAAGFLAKPYSRNELLDAMLKAIG